MRSDAGQNIKGPTTRVQRQGCSAWPCQCLPVETVAMRPDPSALSGCMTTRLDMEGVE